MYIYIYTYVFFSWRTPKRLPYHTFLFLLVVDHGNSWPWIEIIDPPLVVHAISGAYKANWPTIHGNTWYRNVLNAIVE